MRNRDQPRRDSNQDAACRLCLVASVSGTRVAAAMRVTSTVRRQQCSAWFVDVLGSQFRLSGIWQGFFSLASIYAISNISNMTEFFARFDPRLAIGLVVCNTSCFIAGFTVFISFNTPC